MKTFLSLMILLGTSSAFANVSIECGTQVNAQDGTVGKREFLISSEDGKIKVYNSANQEVKSAKVQKDAKGNLVLLVVRDQGIGGPVGVKYVIQDVNDTNITTADKIAVGGFAGGTKVGQLDCVVSGN